MGRRPRRKGKYSLRCLDFSSSNQFPREFARNYSSLCTETEGADFSKFELCSRKNDHERRTLYILTR